MEINTTRDIGRQILRHRSFSFQEFSQRYADPTQDMGFVTREARLQDTKNRQNSVETSDEALQQDWKYIQENLIESAQTVYHWAISNGIAKEQARAVLPEGLILSRMYMAGSLRSWIHYILIRSNKDTQKEHREIAMQAWEEIVIAFPSLKEVLAPVDI
jgi:thymidylate synthase (FAD)